MWPKKGVALLPSVHSYKLRMYMFLVQIGILNNLQLSKSLDNEMHAQSLPATLGGLNIFFVGGNVFCLQRLATVI